MPNSRVIWSVQQIAIKNNAGAPTGEVASFRARHYITGALASGVNEVSGIWEVPRGLQSCGVDTTFNVEEVFQYGQIEVYEQSERQPDITVNLSKAMDGTKPLWFMVTDPAQGNDLVARTASYKCDVALQIYRDTQFRATGAPLSIMTGSGMFVSSHTFTFPIDGFSTEDCTLIGNDKIWGTLENISGITAGNGGTRPLVNFFNDQNGGNPTAPEGLPSGVFGHDGNTSLLVEGGASETAGPPDRFGIIPVGSGIQRREDTDIRRSVLPQDIPGVKQFNASGINAAFVNGGFGANGPGTASNATQLIGDANTDNIIEHIQTITLQVDLGRDDIFEQGHKRAFARPPAFPVEVTSSFEVITSQGDFVNADSGLDVGPDNTAGTNTIIIRTVDGTQIDLGDQNRLVSVSTSDGDAGGGNRSVTYNFQSFNTWNVSHDYFQPNHRIIIFNTGNSRFNVGAPNFRRQDLGIF